MKKNKKSTVTKAIVIFTVFMMFVFVTLTITTLGNDYGENQQELFGEFSHVGNDVYAMVPSNGYYLIPEADINTFHPISDDIHDRHVGVDKNNVYCGNLVLANMDPSKAKPLGNNYYSDGSITYYCGAGSIRNDELSAWKEVIQILGHKVFKTKKPQNYIYPMKALPKSQDYKPILDYSILTDGKQAYYEGNLMPSVQVDTLHRVRFLLDGQTRTSSVYFSDGNHVYYKNELLPINDNQYIYSIEVSSQSNEHYLYNARNGMVYINNLPFDKTNAPYNILSKHGAHVNHTLWVSNNGVFFYNTVEQKVQKAGENPFLEGEYKEIAPLVFSNGKDTLYVDCYEKWNKDKKSGNWYLDSRSTVINHMDDVDAEGAWEKIGDFHTFGSVWKNGADYYYFDNYGEFADQTDYMEDPNRLIYFSNTVYRITDQQTIHDILYKDDTMIGEFIRSLVDSKKIIPLRYTEVFKAETVYDVNGAKIWNKIAIILITTAVILRLYYFFRRK